MEKKIILSPKKDISRYCNSMTSMGDPCKSHGLYKIGDNNYGELWVCKEHLQNEKERYKNYKKCHYLDDIEFIEFDGCSYDDEFDGCSYDDDECREIMISRYIKELMDQIHTN